MEKVDGVKAQRALYDRVASGYDKAIPHHVARHYLERRLTVIERMAEGGPILNVGCGSGNLDAALAGKGYEVVGIDLSVGMLGEARGKGLEGLVRSSATRLPFKTGAFKATLSIVVLHHLLTEANVRTALEEMHRVTAPNGCLIVWDHNPKNPYWGPLMRRLPQDSGEERLVPLEEILSCLGGKVAAMEARRLGFVPDFVPRRLLWLFAALERVAEALPLVREFAAHNVVIAKVATAP